MAWTDAENQRVTAIEEIINEMQVAMNNLATKLQLRQLLAIKQAEIDALKTRVSSLESQIQILQDRIG